MAVCTLAVLILRIAYVQFWHPYGLAPDEAQYWTWLAHNDWSFLTKPPLTTWLMGISTAVLGKTLLGVKLFALLGQGLVSLLGFAIAKEIGGQKAGWWAWLLLTTVPLIAVGGLLMSPDAVLLPFWLAALYSVVRALNRTDEKALCWSRWILIGVLVGLGGLAKYSAAFFYPALGVYLLVWRREWLLRPQVWVSGIIALAFQTPVLIWNMQHGWVGLSHVLWQMKAHDMDDAQDVYATWKGVSQFVGSQVLVLGPIVFGMMSVALVRVAVQTYRGTRMPERKRGTRFLVVVGVGITAMFVGMSFFTKVQANWPILGTVVGVVLLAVWLGQVRRKSVVWIAVAGIVLNAALSGIMMDTYKARSLGILPLKEKLDPTKDLRGWAEMGNLVGVMMYKLDKPIILSSRYQTLAPLMFHTIGNPEFAYMNAEGKRLNEYDLWPLPDLNGRLVVYVNEQSNLPEKVKGMFSQCEPWHTVGVEEYGIQVRKLSMWLCWGTSRNIAMNNVYN